MRKKKILFIISNLQTGGVSKSLTSLMNVIDRNRYDVTLMIVSPTGAFMELLPSDIRILTNPVWSMLTSRLSGCGQLLKSGHPLLAMMHLIRLGVSMFSKSTAARLIARMMPSVNEDFDVVVDYNGQQQLYYMIDSICASRKITFFHSDYAKWPYYYKADKMYINKADRIFTISEQCAESLRNYFPEAASKIQVMENISSLDMISRLSECEVTDLKDDIPSLITVGHVCENKGFTWAMQALKLMISSGVEVNWYFIGSIADRKYVETQIEETGVGQYVHLLGIRTNPYPYIRRATIVVHPSKFEGKSVALDEAKLLCKPIVVTDFSTVHDQFTNRHNATICRMTPESIAASIMELLDNQDLRQKYSDNLMAERRDNTSEVEKLYKLFDAEL